MEKASGAVYVDKSEGGQRAPSTRTTPITDFPHFIQHDLNIPFAVHTPATVNTFDAAKSDSPSIVVCGLVARGGSDSTGDTAKWNVDHMFVRQRVLSRQGMQASLEAAISDFGSRGEVRDTHSLYSGALQCAATRRGRWRGCALPIVLSL